ncbi:MAG: hypothetical protein V4523_07775 [Pseudomonadota bacterium]
MAESIYCVGDHLCRDEAASNIAKAIRALPLPAAEEKAGVGEAQEIVSIANRYQGANGDEQATIPIRVLRAAAGVVNGVAFAPLVNRMASLSPAAHADVREADAMRAEIADLKSSVVAFGAPWAVQYAKDFGLPANHIHATHYDILAKAGARMVDFIRHVPTPPAALDEDAPAIAAIYEARQPIEQHARTFKGRRWVPLELAESELQFWQKRDVQWSMRFPLAESKS